MYNFIKTFGQYIQEVSKDERVRASQTHNIAVKRGRAEHQRILDTGDRRSDDVEKKRWRRKRRTFQKQRIHHAASDYDPTTHRFASYEPDHGENIEEVQSGSKQSPVDASTASSNLKYKSGSRHATGTTKRPEKKRASKAARRAGKEEIPEPGTIDRKRRMKTFHSSGIGGGIS